MGATIAVYTLLSLGLFLCFFGRFPGQILAYAGMLIAAFAVKNHFYPTWLLVLCGVLVVGSLLVNKFLAPKLAAKVHEYGKAGKWGTIIGSILSIFFALADINGIVFLLLFILLPYVFAFIFESISKKNVGDGAKRAAGAYTLFATTSMLNIVISLFCFYEVVYGWEYFSIDFNSSEQTKVSGKLFKKAGKKGFERSIYEDLTAEEVLKINETTPSFRMFYDEIRSAIVNNSDEYDKVEFGKVKYSDMYKLFYYWSSFDFSDYLDSYQKSYDAQMAQYQVRIDSISNEYRLLIDKYKVEGDPDFDYDKIFEHATPVVSPTGNLSTFRILFYKGIKDEELFNEVGFESLSFETVMSSPIFKDYNWGKKSEYAYYKTGNCLSWRMESSAYGSWECEDRPAMVQILDDLDPDDWSGSEMENFEKAFEWTDTVRWSRPSYNDFLRKTIPEVIYNYWKAQEGSSITEFLEARNEMIVTYLSRNYTPLSQLLPMEAEEHLKAKYSSEYTLYQKALPGDRLEFESATERIMPDCREVPDDYALPISLPRGNYVIKITKEE